MDSVGTICRHWRHLRRRSQLDLSLDAGVSTRHLSFVETGRSRPSRELILTLGRHLDMPLREQNRMLLAAGFAPQFTDTSLSDPNAEHIKSAVDRLLDTHQPFPGVAVDGDWNVVAANDAALGLVAGLPDHLLTPTINIYRVSLHPDGLAGRSPNVSEWGPDLIEQLRRTMTLSGRQSLKELYDEVRSYPNVVGFEQASRQATVMLPFVVRTDDDTELSLFTTITTFGTPHDVTVGELAIELFFPADEPTEISLRAAG